MLFKSESEGKPLENIRFSQFVSCSVFNEINFQTTRIFLISADEMMTSKFRKGLTFKTN